MPLCKCEASHNYARPCVKHMQVVGTPRCKVLHQWVEVETACGEDT